MKPTFSTLVALTFVCAALLAPFAFSNYYLPMIRESDFDLHSILHDNVYKQITGYTSLVFVVLEMLFTARKRGRGWLVKISLPGSMMLWRRLHIFLGVALLGTTLIHTVGSNGLNFNAIFLWVFFGVTLSALVGAAAETGILESPRRYFGWQRKGDRGGIIQLGYSKGELIRNLRSLWLGTHLLLVSLFLVMLGVHIFLAYYFQ